FDDMVTAPLHGFAGVDDYYARASSRQFLAGVQRPTLVLHARNDPFMFAHSVPTAQELSPHIRLELSEHGGHVGFVEGRIPGLARYWLERRIPQWLGETLV
ncbi:MAG: hydrolase, partial [Gammaproteobacteria bacterium]|nr:hydrolase [Gammaproteobacteria bacterium]MDX5375096.1 hydrolase [Gammaproteobacteria bacterium]